LIEKHNLVREVLKVDTILSKQNVLEEIEMRQVYAQTLREMFDNKEPVVALDADLMFASGMRAIWPKYPENVFECGIAESNMLGVAAGLSKEGKIPFVHSFGVFCSRRALDQIYMSCSYSKLNVKVVGSDPGIAAALNGGTHAANEDIGHLRPIPEITIVEPTDSTMFKEVLKLAAKTYGVFYIRMFRMKATKIYEEGSEFELGKAVQLRDGKDVTIIASGLEVPEALKAADMLTADGISSRVLDMFTIKPIDEEAIIKAARETGAIVTAENHSITGGLGSAVAEVLAEKCYAPLERIGIKNIFGEENFLGNIVRTTGTTTGQDAKNFGKSFDFILPFAKSAKYNLSKLDLSEDDKLRFNNEDDVGSYALLQLRKTGNADLREDRPGMYYAVFDPEGNDVYPIGPGGYESRWRFGPKGRRRMARRVPTNQAHAQRARHKPGVSGRLRPRSRILRRKVAISLTRAGCSVATLLVSPRSSLRLYNCGRGALPNSVFVLAFIRGPLLGSTYFQSPWIRDSVPACSTKWSRPACVRPSRAPSTSKLSGASAKTSFWPVRAAIEAGRSIWQARASETPGLTRCGQRTANGTRVPPSKALYLPPRNGPAGSCPSSNSTAWS